LGKRGSGRWECKAIKQPGRAQVEELTHNRNRGLNSKNVRDARQEDI